MYIINGFWDRRTRSSLENLSKYKTNFLCIQSFKVLCKILQRILLCVVFQKVLDGGKILSKLFSIFTKFLCNLKLNTTFSNEL